MPRRANINKKVADLIFKGHPVYSLALGRVGHISHADDNGVSVKHWNHPAGWTTFNAGDPVKIVRNDHTRRYEVVNIYEKPKPKELTAKKWGHYVVKYNNDNYNVVELKEGDTITAISMIKLEGLL